MADSLDDGPREPRSILTPILEGLSVVAFLAAILLWQSDETQIAARNLVASWGWIEPAPEPMLKVAASVPSALPAEDAAPPASSGLDPAPTGSIAALVAAADADLPDVNAAPSGWVAACDGGVPAFCTASQSLALPGEPGIETSWTIEKSGQDVVAVWTTPTSVVISRGMMLTLGEGKPRLVPYESCGPRSCEVRAKLADDFIALLRKAGHAQTQIVLRGGRVVTFDFVPMGLPEALATLGAG